jgi:hypothetical protein
MLGGDADLNHEKVTHKHTGNLHSKYSNFTTEKGARYEKNRCADAMAVCLGTALSGCIVVPEGGGYHDHYHDHY